MDSGLKFREDGTFTIVQFTDLHWQNGEEGDLRTRALMERVLEAERPDLIVFTGDLIYSEACEAPLESIRQATAAASASGIPWAAVLGNHDAEAGVTRAELHRTLLALPGSLVGDTPGLTGCGNYALELAGTDGRAAATLYFLDSGDYSRHPAVPGYSWFARDQVEWYASHAREGARRARDMQEMQEARDTQAADWPTGAPPAMMFFHIPLPEHAQAWEAHGCCGERHEAVCCAQVNGGLFAALLEGGDVGGVFVGHDHINDYVGELHGILLGYGRATGYATYGKEGFARGARVIRLNEGRREFDTWLRLEGGEQVRQAPAKRQAEGEEA
ncbi:metallophosphoesterase family protein [Paenibacillus albicereus]|uniref:Metallophosphoesterase family protein n=1 Tax=Paenibacillus albicereus TaxID=2726185 RepID=A0A6H2H1G5_9BACL|nr:metallophosphoesterase family protein [Paenibacillus albicereus]QJC53531.1 metallophosphoesterase family protein [Paenibacillus albicereus]